VASLSKGYGLDYIEHQGKEDATAERRHLLRIEAAQVHKFCAYRISPCRSRRRLWCTT
jgi:hypothetical protein